MASIIVRFVSIVPLFALVLASIFCLTGCREKPTSAVNNDKVVQDSVVMPTDTVKVLTDDEKIDSVRATLKGYKIAEGNDLEVAELGDDATPGHISLVIH